MNNSGQPPASQPEIVVLDGYTLNPGDLSWEGLHALGQCVVYDRTPRDQTIERALSAEIVLTNKTVLSAEIIVALPKLEYVGVLATGYNQVDLEAAKEKGIVVSNVPIYGTTSVAQMVFAHLLNLTQRVSEHSRDVAAGDWAASEDFCFWNYPLVELEGLTMGIVGFGRIGRATAKLAHAFGMRVVASTRTPVELPDYVTAIPLKDLFEQSDVVSLHCALTPETKHIVNASRLAQMKSTAFLINTSRGPLIDEAALAEALNKNQIAGAGLDVLAVEPPPADHPLIGASNCVITPHIAWASRSARSRLLDTAVANVAAYLEGKPQNVVS